jgi:hypothetical protein
MNRRDKLKVINEANQRVEQSYLKSKGFLKENVSDMNIDSLLKNKEVQKIVQDLASDPNKLKKAAKELISAGLDKDVLVKSIQTLKKGGSIDSIIKSGVETISENRLMEVEDDVVPGYNEKLKDDESSSVSDDHKKWADEENYGITGYGGKEDMLAGAKLGGIVGGLGGALVSAGILSTGHVSADALLPILVGIVGAAFAGAYATKDPIHKDIK